MIVVVKVVVVGAVEAVGVVVGVAVVRVVAAEIVVHSLIRYYIDDLFVSRLNYLLHVDIS